MRVKRYVADSLQEAIARVKADLGRNAIILHTKQFKEGGFFGFFAQRRFEVIAAIDENPTPVIVKTDSAPVLKPQDPVSIHPDNLPAPPPPLMAKTPAVAMAEPKPVSLIQSEERAILQIPKTEL
ncbi:MAG TPA: hypothetical protein VEC37_09950, partial [Bacillota bacterium]|nr:hypothetical protein [Bacillota bacterium]